MKNKKSYIIVSLATLVLCGCASYTIHPLSGDEAEQHWKSKNAEKGYVFYQPELYFLVNLNSSSTNKDQAAASQNKATVTPLYLPNPKKAYRLTTFNFLAKSEFIFNFTDGWQLTSITDKGDNTTVASALAGQLASTITAAAAATKGFGGGNIATNTTFLLHPEYDGEGVITGFTPVLSPLKSN